MPTMPYSPQYMLGVKTWGQSIVQLQNLEYSRNFRQKKSCSICYQPHYDIINIPIYLETLNKIVLIFFHAQCRLSRPKEFLYNRASTVTQTIKTRKKTKKHKTAQRNENKNCAWRLHFPNSIVVSRQYLQSSLSYSLSGTPLAPKETGEPFPQRK